MKPRTNPHTKKRRAAPMGSPEAIAAYKIKEERLHRDFMRKIRAWARNWERCSLAGCRRNVRCLKPDSCREVPKELTQEMLLRIRAAIHPESVAREAEAAAWARRIRESFDDGTGDADRGE